MQRGRDRMDGKWASRSVNVATSSGVVEQLTGLHELNWIEAHLDIKEKFNPAGKYPWHPCSHVRVTCTTGKRPPYKEYSLLAPGIINPFGETTIYAFTGDFQCKDWSQVDVASNQISLALGDLSQVSGYIPDDVAGYHSREALRSITEQMPSQISIANFLFEFKDGLKALLPQLKGNGVQNVGSGWLWWNFGALPLVQDIKALLGTAAAINKRLAFLKKVNGKTVTVRYKARWSNPTMPHSNPPGEFFDSPLALEYGGWPKVEWMVADLQMNSRVYYNLNLQGADVMFNAWCSALGLNNPAQIVWEAIPFSFVVDWFTNVQEWLEDNVDTSQPFEGEIAVRGSDHSIRKRYLISYCVPTDNVGGWDIVDRALVREYHRRPGPFGGTLTEDGLNAHQLSLGAALLAQGLGGHPIRRR